MRKIPFHLVFEGGEEEKLPIFPLHHPQKLGSNSLGVWRGGVVDECFKRSG